MHEIAGQLVVTANGADVAGYCVITYLLGIGDRHLDNVLLTTGGGPCSGNWMTRIHVDFRIIGNLFHIDFGFILGRDPKPFPPPMKLSREMVEAMGGASSQAYQKFKSYCFIAFNSLRKNANLILNLFSLMVNANVPDIAIEPDKAVFKVRFIYTNSDADHSNGLVYHRCRKGSDWISPTRRQYNSSMD